MDSRHDPHSSDISTSTAQIQQATDVSGTQRDPGCKVTRAQQERDCKAIVEQLYGQSES